MSVRKAAAIVVAGFALSGFTPQNVECIAPANPGGGGPVSPSTATGPATQAGRRTRQTSTGAMGRVRRAKRMGPTG